MFKNVMGHNTPTKVLLCNTLCEICNIFTFVIKVESVIVCEIKWHL